MKKWYLSKGVMGGVFAMILGVTLSIGYALPADVTPEWLTDNYFKLAEAVTVIASGVMAVYGRVKAVKRISK